MSMRPEAYSLVPRLISSFHMRKSLGTRLPEAILRMLAGWRARTAASTLPARHDRDSGIALASFPGSHAPEREIEVVHAWRAWYFLSREKCQR